MQFAPAKFELVHFTRSRTKFNLSASIQVQELTLHPKTEVRVLGVWLDTKLQWSAHARYTLARAKGQAAVFDRLVKSTWGPTFRASRQLYTSIARPTMAYGASAWFEHAKPSVLTEKLKRVQSRCLRLVSGAYKATPIHILEAELFVPPIDLYLVEQVQVFRNQ